MQCSESAVPSVPSAVSQTDSKPSQVDGTAALQGPVKDDNTQATGVHSFDFVVCPLGMKNILT